jgi:hypothetical protein
LSHLVVDDLSDIASWRARTPAGAPSSAIAIEPGSVSRLGGPTMKIEATTAAQGHRVERTLGPLDVKASADLEVWVRSDRIADGSDSRPFFLELRLGSAALAIGAPANTWHRLIPVTAPNVWQPVPLALDDLPAAVRGAVTQIRLTVVDASTAFVLHLDRIVAIRDELLGDVDAALLDRLGGKLELDGTPVPAVVEPAQAPNQPFLRIRNHSVRPAPERSPSGGMRTDYTGQGFSIRPPSVPVDVLYAIDAVADDRADAARLLEFAFAAVVPQATLDVGGRPRTIEWVEAPALAPTEVPTHPTVYVRVATAQRASAAREAAIPPFNRIDVEVDSRASA